MNAKNLAVFYYVYEEYAEVYVQNIIYQKRDLSRILSERYTDLDESDWKTTNPVHAKMFYCEPNRAYAQFGSRDVFCYSFSKIVFFF